MRSKGFTLIELVVVIVVLGILATVAVPRFMNYRDDARAATMQGVLAALKASVDLAHTKLALDNLEKESQVISSREPKLKAWCEYCTFAYGYPAHYKDETWPYITRGINEDIAIIFSRPHKQLAFAFKEDISSDGKSLNTDNCYILWQSAGKRPDGTFVEAGFTLVPCASS